MEDGYVLLDMICTKVVKKKINKKVIGGKQYNSMNQTVWNQIWSFKVV